MKLFSLLKYLGVILLTIIIMELLLYSSLQSTPSSVKAQARTYDTTDRQKSQLKIDRVLSIYLAAKAEGFVGGTIESTIEGYCSQEITRDADGVYQVYITTQPNQQSEAMQRLKFLEEEVSFMDASDTKIQYTDIKKGDKIRVTFQYDYGAQSEKDITKVRVRKV